MGKGASKISSKEIDQLKKETHFTEEEIKSWSKGFKKDCPDGKLTLEGFVQLYKQFYPYGDPSKFVNLVFNVFDENKDGFISFSEFIRAISATSRGSVQEKLKIAFRLCDQDNDGLITRVEMTVIVDALYRMIGDLVELPDDENTPEKRVSRIFRVIDKNNDDKLTIEEFVEGFKEDPAIGLVLNMCDTGP